MNVQFCWTIGGDFHVVDADDDDTPLAEVVLHEPFRSMAIDDARGVARTILEAMSRIPHPYGRQPTDSDGETE